MTFREVSVVEIFEVLRLWLRGSSFRAIERLARVDRRTAAGYVEAAQIAGLVRDGGEVQLTDELVGQVVGGVRPSRPDGHGDVWRLCEEHRDFLAPLVKARKLRLTKIHDLLQRRIGDEVPYATLHRFVVAELGFGRPRVTVALADGEPGRELQVDFGRMGLIADPGSGGQRVCHGLIFTAVVSRHMFVWLTFSQTLRAVIDGFEAAWVFFGGVFAVVIPDNLKAIVDKADPITPRINKTFMEYAQSRGFLIDPARVRTPTDKARVERTVPYARAAMFAGETFRDIGHAQEHANVWCRDKAGIRIHGTTGLRPLEVFEADELARLGPVPAELFDTPVWQQAKVARDFHIQVACALYSVPYGLVGVWVDVRADSRLVKVFYRGELVKTHLRLPRGRTTDPADMPAERRDYAMRDIESLQRKAATHGPSIGIYAARLLEVPLPWTRMRTVYRLLGLVGRYGSGRVEAACSKALDVDVVDVNRIKRILELGLDVNTTGIPAAAATPARAAGPTFVQLRFARANDEFRLGGGQ